MKRSYFTIFSILICLLISQHSFGQELSRKERKDLIKQANVLVEKGKVSIRNARRDAMDELKKAVKDGYPEDAGKTKEGVIQDLTNKYSAEIDRLMKLKEADIMKI